jgi:hypothetical protein
MRTEGQKAEEERIHDRVSAGFAASASKSQAQWRLEGKARSWRYDELLERLDRMRAEDPTRFAALPAVRKIQLGYYVGAREAARKLGIDTSAPAGAGGGEE